MLWNSILLAVKEIRRNLLRSFLTMLGIVIGVSAVITMVTLGNGATQAVKDQISSLGSNLLMIRQGQGPGPGREAQSAPPFKMSDAEAIESQIASIRYVAPTVNSGAAVVYGAKNWTTSITGSTTDYFAVSNWRIGIGRAFTEAEEKTGTPACVIGETVRKQLYGAENPVGTSLRVKAFTCEVVGVLAAKGQGGMGNDQDDTIIMPIRTVQRRMAGNDYLGAIMVSAKEGADSDTVQARVEALLRERRNIREGEEDNFHVFDTRQIAETLSGTTKILTMLLGAVAAVSLLVGGIGIMNIMLVSVTERTREIGTRLAIGALESEVLMQFLVEAVALTSVGGLVGLTLAAAASMMLAKVMNVPFVFNLQINVLAFFFSAAIGVAFGYLPAKRAASLDPIDALRHE
jgi:putative ABC transport system permease protein